MIQEWMRFIRRAETRRHAIFLSDYDMLLTEHLVQGVDVWINTPRRPWEACGTSRMKVLVNGGINLSELDGWWAEAYAPEVGWALGAGQEHGDDPAWQPKPWRFTICLNGRWSPSFIAATRTVFQSLGWLVCVKAWRS
jgi:starch phosphorylase